MNTEQKLHAMVWQFREKTAHVFCVPDRIDSIRFAFCECAEALDDYLRQNPLYKRNRDKTHTVERELATAAMMLLTAFGPGEYPDGRFYYGPCTLDAIAAQVATCLSRPQDDGRIRFAVWQICKFVGDGIEQEMADVLADLKRKHMEVEVR